MAPVLPFLQIRTWRVARGGGTCQESPSSSVARLGFGLGDGRSHAPHHHAASPGDHRNGGGGGGGGWSHHPVSTSQLNQYHVRSHGVRWEELKGRGVGGGKKQPSPELGKCCSAALPVPPPLAPAGLTKALTMHHDAVRHTTREARWRCWSQLKERKE